MRQARAPARPDVPLPREAVRRHQRLRQAQQLVDGAPTTARTCSTRATTRTPTPSSWPSWLAVIRARQRPRRPPSRVGIADAGNDHRLGANEAPPAIMSVFLGAQLEDVVDQLEKGAASTSKKGGSMELGVTIAAGPAARTPPTATGPRRSPSPATSSSSARSDPRPPSTGRRPSSTRPSPSRSSSSPTSSTSSSPATSTA